MKVLIIDIDSTIPNLALKKIEKYHLDQGDEVIWDFPLYRHLVDKVYVSCIFDYNKSKCFDYEDDPKCLIGGSGYSLANKLPDEIEKIKPRINFGFTTRGCIRNCYFCIVREKEGVIKVEGDIYDIWDGKSKAITLIDNNILALPEHFKFISKQLIKENLRVDFNQGLDHRLLNEEICSILFSLKHIREIRFAYDDIKYEKVVTKALNLLKKCGLKDWQTRWYVYVGVDDTFETVFERIKLLKSFKQCAYIMRDRKVIKNPEYIALTTYCNFMGVYKFDFKEALKKHDGLRSYQRYIPDKYKN